MFIFAMKNINCLSKVYFDRNNTQYLLEALFLRHTSQQGLACVVSNSLEEDRDSLATSDTCRANAIFLPVPPQLVDEVGGDPGTGGGEGVAQCNST